MKLISWNVNGLRACVGKGFLDAFDEFGADAVCLQETKLQQGQIDLNLEGYQQYWNYAEKKGYSGTVCFTRQQPLNVRLGIGKEEHSHEGRAITLEFPQLYLVNLYVPNAQEGLARIDYRMQWEDDLRAYVQALDAEKSVVICGDFNVAAEEIDLKNPKSNRGNAGFSDQERDCFRRLLAAGFADSFRRLYPDRAGAYSWWSYRFKARQNNAGWRIDYFLVSERLMPHVKDSFILPQVMGSDHCPVGLELDI